MMKIYTYGCLLFAWYASSLWAAQPIQATAEPSAPPVQVTNLQPEPTIQELAPAEACPTIEGFEGASADALRNVITLLNSQSTFAHAPFERDTLNLTEQRLFDIFGSSNYIQLHNPDHAAIKRTLTSIIQANPTIDDTCILRTYLAQRGAPTVTPTTIPAASIPATTPTPPKGSVPAQSAPKPKTPTPSGDSKPKPTGAPLDLKPLNDAIGKLNSALTRIRNAKQAKISIEQRRELKKEAEKLFKENNGKMKIMAQRIHRVVDAPGFAGNPDKIAPFKRFADLYETLEKEIKQLR